MAASRRRRSGGTGADEALVDSLVQVTFSVVAVLSRVATRHELSLTQMRLLGILRDHTPKMSSLARHLGLERSTLSGLVDRAEARGLLLRCPGGGDGRSVEVLITREGAALAELGYGEVVRALAPLVRDLRGGERQLLLGIAERMLRGREP